MKLEAIAVKEDGKAFRIINRALLDKELTELPKGKYRLVVERYRKKKSNPQLGYLYACIYPFVLKGLNDLGWEFTSLDQVDVECKRRFASQEILNRHTGEIMEIPALKRDMTTVEMMTYVDAIRNWASEYLSVYIPEPGEMTDLNFETNE